MKRLQIIVIAFVLSFSGLSVAKDLWICTEAASQRFGSEIRSCGIGIDKTEAKARSIAFDNAKVEFNKVCALSDDCKNHELRVDPKRTSCSSDGEIYKCYRMIVFEIQSSLKKENIVTNFVNNTSGMAPIKAVTKLKKGMTVRQVIAILGEPTNVQDFGAAFGERPNQSLFFEYYDRPFCSHGLFCSVSFGNKKVDHWSDFAPLYTDSSGRFDDLHKDRVPKKSPDDFIKDSDVTIDSTPTPKPEVKIFDKNLGKITFKK